MTRRSIRCNMCFELGHKRNFWRSYGHLKNLKFVWWLWWKLDVPRQNHILVKNDPTNKFLNVKNRLIVFSSSSSTHRHTSTRSCYNIYSRLWGLSVPTFRIFEDFEDFDWAPVIFTHDVQQKTYEIFIWKYFFSEKSKFCHGGCS